MGKLVVKVICGRNLKGADFFSAGDCYVRLSIGSKEMRTKAINNDANPNWNETFSFFVSEASADNLKIELWDANTFKDDHITSTMVPLNDLVKDTRILKRVALPEGKGEVHLELLADFGAAGGAPPMMQQQQQQMPMYSNAPPPHQQTPPQQQMTMGGQGGYANPYQGAAGGYSNPYQQGAPGGGSFSYPANPQGGQQYVPQGGPFGAGSGGAYAPPQQQQQQAGGYPTAANYGGGAPGGGGYSNPYSSAGYQNPYASQYPSNNNNGQQQQGGGGGVTGYSYPGYGGGAPQQQQNGAPQVGGLGYMPNYY